MREIIGLRAREWDMYFASRFVCFPVFLITFCSISLAVATPNQPNSDPVYRQLRDVGLGGEQITVTNVVLKRDAGTFTFRSGSICFLAPVQGKVTGAIFTGDGTFDLVAPIAVERHSLALFTKSEELHESFNHLVLRFTDNTYDELKPLAAPTPATGACQAGLLQDSQHTTRHRLHYNLEARMLQDLLSTEPAGLFLAFIHGKKYEGKLLYEIDPHGLANVEPEEVALINYNENKFAIWTSFHLASEYASGTVSSGEKDSLIQVDHHQLDTIIEKSGHLIGKASTTVVAQGNGVRMVPFNLYPSLRVESVTAANGQILSYIQEDKRDDPQYWVILPSALAKGEQYSIVTQYGGKDAVSNEGGGNYYPVTRDAWYPNSYFGDYASYDMIFRIPKGMTMVATGTLVNESTEGDHQLSHWRSEVPLTVAGFNFGKFKVEHGKLEKLDYLVESYANQETPDIVNEIKRAGEGLPLGNMGTTPLLKKALAEGQLATQIFSDYFGPLPYKRLAITQQTAFSFGQSWPGLVYLPITYFFDNTVRHVIGMDDPRGYFKVVAPHEVAHQWWGHEVGFDSYRDQWMSEGFADMSASIYLQAIYQDHKQFIEFWNDERKLLLERNKEGFRAIDAGPVTLGYRLSNSRTGFDITRRLIYPKGAYILHMVRMMMWDRSTGDQPFKDLMHDFAQTYANRTATTEDFKAMLEKHMQRGMDLDSNHRMDWFFNEYVFGTALPNYNLTSSIGAGPDGNPVLSIKLVQSNVDDRFRMLIPIYLELANGANIMIGRVHLTGNATFEQNIPLQGLKERPRRATVNYLDDVLCTQN
jgi:hypothetical protein